MIKFNELRVTNDGQYLIIDAEIMEQYLPYFIEDSVTIRDIYVDTDKTYTEGRHSSNYVYHKTINPREPKVRLIIPSSEIDADITNNLLYIWVEWLGLPEKELPCGVDVPGLGVTMHMGKVYNQTMSYIKELGNTCTIPQGFIDSILKYKAVETAINSEHYTEANSLYNKLFTSNIVVSSNGCGCHG